MLVFLLYGGIVGGGSTGNGSRVGKFPLLALVGKLQAGESGRHIYGVLCHGVVVGTGGRVACDHKHAFSW